MGVCIWLRKKIDHNLHIGLRFGTAYILKQLRGPDSWQYLTSQEFRRKRYRNKKHRLKEKRSYSASFMKHRRRKRLLMIARRGPFCQWCLRRFMPDELTIDHIVPGSEGGSSKYRNFQLLCRPCHDKKEKAYWLSSNTQ